MVHRVDITWIRAGESIGLTCSKTVEGESNVDVAIPAATTDQEIAVAFDKDLLAMILITADGDVTLEQNTTTGTAIAIEANVPFLWLKESGIPVPFAADVTKLFATTPAGSTVNLKIRTGYEATP